jgi:hypothetical protein
MARAAKEGLDGADIYSGCCTLKIEYAKVRISTCILKIFFFLVLPARSCERYSLRYQVVTHPLSTIFFFSILLAGSQQSIIVSTSPLSLKNSLAFIFPFLSFSSYYFLPGPPY